MKFNNWFLLFILTLICSCSPKIYPPSEHIVIRDSVNVIIRDSINWIPKERIVDVVPTYDTLKMETSLASSTAYVDTNTHTLKGKIENKKGVEKCIKIVEKYAEKCDTIFVKVPVTVEVEKPVKYIPKFFWGTLVYAVLVTLLFAVKIYLKFRKSKIFF